MGAGCTRPGNASVAVGDPLPTDCKGAVPKEGSREEGFSIKVCRFSGEVVSEPAIDASTTVKELRQLLGSAGNRSNTSFNFQGTNLDVDARLQDVGVTSGSVIFMVSSSRPEPVIQDRVGIAPESNVLQAPQPRRPDSEKQHQPTARIGEECTNPVMVRLVRSLGRSRAGFCPRGAHIEWQCNLDGDLLVSPAHVRSLAGLLGADVIQEPYVVSVLKSMLKTTAQMCNAGEPLEASLYLDILSSERAKRNATRGPASLDATCTERLPNQLIDAESPCVECEKASSCYCPECDDGFCRSCFARLHGKGNRKAHPRLDRCCSSCRSASMSYCLECAESYCRSCFQKVHANGQLGKHSLLNWKSTTFKGASAPWLPAEEGEQGWGVRETWKDRWHVFRESSGQQYYYDFESQKSIRQLLDEHCMWQPPPPLPGGAVNAT